MEEQTDTRWTAPTGCSNNEGGHQPSLAPDIQPKRGNVNISGKNQAFKELAWSTKRGWELTPQNVTDYISAVVRPSAVRERIMKLFRALNVEPQQRDPFDEELRAFPFVNGGLFAGSDTDFIPPLDEALCNLIRDAAHFDWRGISPTIFGGLFESTLNPATRRSGGMHYTSVENIHKVIDPLFLNALAEELHSIMEESRGNTLVRKLETFRDKLASLTFLDPACGSGNFLTETFISLRRLENEALRYLSNGQATFGGDFSRVKVTIQQFFGIEINDFAVSVAKAALWIADAQMWRETQEFTDQQLADFLPLQSYENIREGNALEMDWMDNLPNRHVDYIIGNPPFIGYSLQTKEQKADMQRLLGKARAWGKLDFVCAWFDKAAQILQHDSNTRAAFVSTNSITQGEQAANLWKLLTSEYGVHIDFAYRTFKWANEVRDTAAVHCVIIGFSTEQARGCTIFDEEGIAHTTHQINSYLLDAPFLFIESRSSPLCNVPKMSTGNRPADGGHLIIGADEYDAFMAREPRAAKFIKSFMGADEFIKGKKRWCLWLVSASPAELRTMPAVMERVEACRQDRLNAPDPGRRKLADTPTLFRETNNPVRYVAIPEVSSENRQYIPMAFLNETTICSNLLKLVPDATLYHFGVLSSVIHMAWMRTVAGRLKSDYRYSAKIVYNNFPWPEPTDKQREKIEACAQAVLDARAKYPESTLADLYDPLLMPPELLKAHRALDVAVDAAYGRKFTNDSDRVTHLFELYQKLTKDGK